MIRKFQKRDTGQVMEIWLNGNIDAHPFISKEYWESNFEMVREQLIQAEVYMKNVRAVEFYRREGFSAVSEQLDEDTGEPELTMIAGRNP